jgi:glucose/mannose-6-phosphate isomerase
MIKDDLLKYDTQNMYDHIQDFYKQLIDGISLGETVAFDDLHYAGFKNIILAGMGGSAIGGEILRSFLKPQLKIPFEIQRNYGLPGTADKHTLVICSSYSGGTEETLSAFERALELQCKIICITTGGELLKRAKRNNIPVVNTPAGLMPREALGYSFAPLLTLFSRLGLCENFSDSLRACAEILKKRNNEYSFNNDNNPACELAAKLTGKIIVIYSGPDYLDAIGMRWKGQICENAKQLAFCNVFPEFNHNELVGWESAAKISSNYAVLILRDKDDHKQVAARMDIVTKILKQKGIEAIELWSQGDDILSRVFSLIQLGDYASYYLALLNKVDPTPIELIQYMKQELENY